MSSKRSQKIRKNKQYKLIKSRTERKKRKKRKQESVAPKIQGIDLAYVIKKNSLPVSVLLVGCLVFQISNHATTGHRVDFEQAKQAQSIQVALSDSPAPQEKNPILPASKNHSKSQVKIKLSSDTPASYITPPIINIASASEVPNFTIELDSNISPKAKTKASGVAAKEQEVDIPKISVTPVSKKKTSQRYEVATINTDPYENIEDLKKAVARLTKNTPMEAMLDDIIKRDRAVIAFLLGIGMKESKYGIYSPKKDRNDCFNYWGYRGRENTTASGYSCFATPSHAVQVVGDRIERLIKSGLDSPAEMIVWKCGSNCAGHSEESVDKWIDDVSINYYNLNPRLLSRK